MEKRPDGSKVYRNQKQEELFEYNHKKEKSKSNQSNSDGGDADYDQSLDGMEKRENDFSNKNQYQKRDEHVRRDVTQILKLRISDTFAKANNEQICIRFNLIALQKKS